MNDRERGSGMRERERISCTMMFCTTASVNGQQVDHKINWEKGDEG